MFIRAIIFITLLFPITSHAKDFYFNVGLSSIYTKINDPNYEYISDYEQIKNPFKDSLKSFNLGVSKSFSNNLTISLNTNRLFSKEVKRTVRSKRNGAILLNRTRIKVDTFQIGKRFRRWLPMLFISNVEVDKSLWNDSRYLGRQINHTFLYGVNVHYFILKDVSASLGYIMPNRELYLDSGFFTTINYYF